MQRINLFILGASSMIATLGREAAAFTIETPISDGCHERITADALDAARARVALPSFERAFVLADLPFSVRDGADGASIAVLIAVRDPDLRGLDSLDLVDLAEVHADPDGQHFHCLREPDDDEPSGSTAALDRCKEYIRQEVRAAIAGLEANDTTELTVAHAFSGPRREELPSFHVHVGRALHAFQDSFTHALRTPDGRRVRSVLNYVDQVEERLEEQRDGVPHLGHLDRCDDASELSAVRRVLATEGSADLLEAMLGPAESEAARMERADAVLQEHLAFEPGCTPENAWCNAAEITSAPSCSCSTGQAGRTASLLLVLIGLVVLVRRARWLPLAIVLAAASPASAFEEEPSARRLDRRVSLLVGGGGSLGRLSGVVSIGSRVQLSRGFALELNGEWNPWASASTLRLREGTFNLHLTATWRYAFYGRINFTSKGSLGTSILLFDTEGANRGDVGLFAAASPLGLEVRVSDRLKIFVDPAQVALAAPHLTGIPLIQPQYRFALGLVFDL